MRAIDSLIEELIEEKTTEEMAMIASLNIKSNYVKKVIGERLGKSLTEIVEIIQETNSEILYDGIDNKYFKLIIDDMPLENFILSDMIFFTSVSIIFTNDRINVYYIDPENIDKLNMLKWMTDLILIG